MHNQRCVHYELQQLVTMAKCFNLVSKNAHFRIQKTKMATTMMPNMSLQNDSSQTMGGVMVALPTIYTFHGRSNYTLFPSLFQGIFFNFRSLSKFHRVFN